MAEDNNIFSKRKNQLGSLLNKNSPEANNEEYETKTYLETEDIINDIVFEEPDSFVSDDISIEDESSTQQRSILDEIMNNSSNESFEQESYFEESPMDFNIDENNPFMNNDSIQEEAPEISFEDDEIEDIIEDASDEMQISIEDDYDSQVTYEEEPSLMDDMLSSLDDELQSQQEMSSYIPGIEQMEPEPIVEDEGAYSQAEIDSKRRKTKGSKVNAKDMGIKILVGIVALTCIIGIAFGVNKIINKGLNSSGIENVPIQQPSQDKTPIKKPENSSSIVDDLIGDTNDKIEDETSENSSSVNRPSFEEEDEEDDGSILKTYKGYIIDVKDDSFYIANLTYDKYQFLIHAWQEFQQVDKTTIPVWVDEATGTYHIENCADFAESTAEEHGELVATKITLAEAEEAGYKQELCATNILGTYTTASPKDFDYNQYDELRGVIYKSMMITESSNVLLETIEIGTEVTATYIEDSLSKINELIEVKKSTTASNPGIGDTEQEEGTTETPNKPNTGYQGSSNVWGSKWDAIVATINDRREKEEEANKDKNPTYDKDGQLVLQGKEMYETVNTSLIIGKASIVWFKISWTKNAETKSVPDSEDVAVEILTPNQSLITAENIDKYGKMWIDEATGLVNIVLRNTQAGEYKIEFTKEVGTYLGDVKVQAIPITGLLELSKASAVYTNGRLEVIWNAIGVADDNVIVEIYAKNGKKTVLLYSANSIDDGIHTVDMASINVSKIAGNTYDIILRVTDIDVSADKPKSITATYLSDTITFPNIDIPEQR